MKRSKEIDNLVTWLERIKPLVTGNAKVTLRFNQIHVHDENKTYTYDEYRAEEAKPKGAKRV